MTEVKTMCVIVDLDLVVPAIIREEFYTYSVLEREKEDIFNYFDFLTISPEHIMSFALYMKSLDLGRVVINFSQDDARKYIKIRSDIFKEIDDTDVYMVKINDNSARSINTWIEKSKSKLNYSKRVLSSVGLECIGAH